MVYLSLGPPSIKFWFGSTRSIYCGHFVVCIGTTLPMCCLRTQRMTSPSLPMYLKLFSRYVLVIVVFIGDDLYQLLLCLVKGQ